MHLPVRATAALFCRYILVVHATARGWWVHSITNISDSRPSLQAATSATRTLMASSSLTRAHTKLHLTSLFRQQVYVCSVQKLPFGILNSLLLPSEHLHHFLSTLCRFAEARPYLHRRRCQLFLLCAASASIFCSPATYSDLGTT